MTVLVAALAARQVWLAARGDLNVDEFENLQLLWLWARDVLPCRDYEHTHLPLYNFLLAPLYRAAGPVPTLPGLVRIALLPVVALTVAQVAWLGRRLAGGSPGGLLAAALFLASPWTAATLAEMRPDAVMFPLALGAVMLHLGYLDDPGARPRRLLGTAALLGLGLLFSQKAVLLVLALAWETERVHARRAGSAPAWRAARMAGFAAVVALPFAAAAVLLRAALGLSASDLELLLTSGVARQVTDFHRASKAIAAAALIGPLAPVALLALVEAVRGRFWTGGADGAESGRKVAGAFVAVSAVQLLALPFLVGQMVVLPLAFAAVLAAAALARLRPVAWFAAVLLAVLLANAAKPYPYPTRDAQVAQLRFLAGEVGPDRPVLDVQTGLGLYHPFLGRHLFYRPGLYDERIGAAQTAAVARALSERRYGAVVDRYGLTANAPAAIRELLATEYRRGPWDGLLLPNGGPSGAGGGGR